MDKTIYFDNAATTFPKPNMVYEKMDSFYRNYGVNAGRSSYKMAREANNLIIDTRSKLSKLVNFNHSEKIIFTPSATIALNQIIGGLNWNEHNTVYVTPFEHNAIMRPLNYIKEKYNIRIEVIPFDPVTFELDIDMLKVMFSRNYPDYIFMSHVSNVTGLILPIKEIIEASLQYNSIVILDCAQSMGLLPIDINRIKADYFVFAGHKTLYGPFGVAGFIDNSKIKLKEFIIGGTGSDSLNLHMPEQYPTKYEPASPNILAIAGLNASLDWIDETGIESILNSEKILIRKLVNEMKDIYGIELYLPKDEEKHVGIISLNMQDYNPNELGQVLDEDFNIAVRTGFHCAPLIHNFINTENKGGTVRISLGYFNSENDIDNLIRSLREL